MSDLFATLVRRARGADVLAPVIASAYERPLGETAWGEQEEVRVVSPASAPSPGPTSRAMPRADRSMPAAERRPVRMGSEERRTSPPHPVAEERAALPVRDDADVEETASVPALDLGAIIDAALRQRSGVAHETVIVREAGTAPHEEREIELPERVIERREVVVMPAAPVIDAPVAERRSPPAAPSVEVRIGRIEVVAAPAPAPPPAPALRHPRTRALTLQDYLARRARR